MSTLHPVDVTLHQNKHAQPETVSVLALSAVLLEISSMQQQILDEGVRDTLNQCEETLLDAIHYYASQSAERMQERDDV